MTDMNYNEPVKTTIEVIERFELVYVSIEEIERLLGKRRHIKDTNGL